MSLLRKVIIFFVVVLLTLGATFGYVMQSIDKEYARDPVTLNPGGGAAALVVYHPGLTGFQLSATMAYAEGLADAGWRVEVHTAGGLAPTDITGYGLLVLGSPTYGAAPAPSIPSYMNKLGSLDGVKVAVVMTGSTDPGTDAMVSLVEQRGGEVVDVVELSKMPWGSLDLEPVKVQARSLAP